MTTPLTLLQHARLLITNPDNWTQGRLHDRDKTCFCAMGALAHARDRAFRLSDVQPSIKAFYEAEAILDSLTLERFGCSYVTYNDLESTTHADILHLFDEAIAKAKAEEQLPAPAPATAPAPALTPSERRKHAANIREALTALQQAQDALEDANSLLAAAGADDFNSTVSIDPGQWSAVRKHLQQRLSVLLPKFQPGDRVRLIESKNPESVGALLTIVGPVEGYPYGWYETISDKPLSAVMGNAAEDGTTRNPGSEEMTHRADVFCTRIEKVARIEDLIGELVTDASDLLQICRGSRGWMVNLPTQDPYVEARGDDLLSALTNLRDTYKEVNK